MKEILTLHQKILALPENVRPEEGIDFSREDAGEDIDLLPSELRDELEAVREAIKGVVPEDFDYFAFAGQPDEDPFFGLECERMPVNCAPADGEFEPDRSLIEQLREVNWEKARAKAAKLRKDMDDILYAVKKLSEPLRSTKSWQREFREETREFVKEKRADAGRIHVLYWDEEKGMMEADFDDGEALREALPDFIVQEAEIIAIVAQGKPLPVERIDALKAQAQKTLRERVRSSVRTATEEKATQEAQTEETDRPLS
jgi:hypothetical protein